MIDIYDDVFTYDDRLEYLSFMKKSLYQVNGYDQTSAGEIQLYSFFTMNDADRMGLTQTKFFKEISSQYSLDKRTIKQIRVNLTTSAERNKIHTDGNGLTLLYYANTDWDVEWGGHTLFMDHHMNDVKDVVLYKPGRVVVFDGKLPHMIMTPSNMCTTARFTFVIQYGDILDGQD